MGIQTLRTYHFEASEDIMTKFKSQALRVIRIKYWKACGSGNPSSFISALWNIGILFHKQATSWWTLYSLTHFTPQHTLLLSTLCISAHFDPQLTLIIGALFSLEKLLFGTPYSLELGWEIELHFKCNTKSLKHTHLIVYGLELSLFFGLFGSQNVHFEAKICLVSYFYRV